MRPTVNNLRNEKPANHDNVNPKDKRAVKKQIKEVHPDVANVEAEKGETVVAPGMGFFNIGGQTHANGGTDLLLPDGSFVFSDDSKLKITGAMAKMFGKGGDKKYTPAELSKQYEINKYLAILKDPDADYFDKVTAELMVQNNMKKLNELAVLQEGSKGFPGGVPQVEDLSETFMKKGGYYSTGGGKLTPFDDDPHPGDKKAPRKDQKAKGLKAGFNKFSAPWLKDYGYEDSYDGFTKAMKAIGYVGGDDVKAMQKYLVDKNYKEGNFQTFADIYSNYGNTNQGYSKFGEVNPHDLQGYTDDLVDGFAGVRTGLLAAPFLHPKVGDLWKKYDSDIGAPTDNTPAPKPAGAPPINQSSDGTTGRNVPMPNQLGFNTLQKMDIGNSLFDMATVRKGEPTRYQNYGLEQASQIAANVRPYDYQSILNEVSKQATNAYRANNTIGSTAAARQAGNASIFGQALEGASKVKQDEYNQNAGLYNQNQQQLAQYASLIGGDKMQNAMVYNDAVERMRDNYSKEVKFLKNQALGKVNMYAMANQATMYDNMLHPEFTFDPGKGFAGESQFNPRSNVFGFNNGTSGGGNNLERMTKYIRDTFGVQDQEKALSFALQALRSDPTMDDAALGNRQYLNPVDNQRMRIGHR